MSSIQWQGGDADRIAPAAVVGILFEEGTIAIHELTVHRSTTLDYKMVALRAMEAVLEVQTWKNRALSCWDRSILEENTYHRAPYVTAKIGPVTYLVECLGSFSGGT